MVRLVLYLLLAVVLITVLRMVIGIVVKFLGSLFSVASAMSDTASGGPAPGAPPVSPGGDLHRDPVCGTFVSEGSRFQNRVSGQRYYYCSEECRSKHAALVS